jgi:hypothetical protein
MSLKKELLPLMEYKGSRPLNSDFSLNFPLFYPIMLLAYCSLPPPSFTPSHLSSCISHIFLFFISLVLFSNCFSFCLLSCLDFSVILYSFSFLVQVKTWYDKSRLELVITVLGAVNLPHRYNWHTCHILYCSYSWSHRSTYLTGMTRQTGHILYCSYMFLGLPDPYQLSYSHVWIRP